jgi:hypothetical protein
MQRIKEQMITPRTPAAIRIVPFTPASANAILMMEGGREEGAEGKTSTVLPHLMRQLVWL